MLDRTEGLPLSRLSWPFLKRNLPANLESQEETGNPTYEPPLWSEDGLIVRISPNSYNMLYDPGTADWWAHSPRSCKRGLGAYEEVREARKRGFEAFVGDREKNEWMRETGEEEIRKVKEAYESWIRDGPPPPVEDEVEVEGGLDGANERDEIMGGT